MAHGLLRSEYDEPLAILRPSRLVDRGRNLPSRSEDSFRAGRVTSMSRRLVGERRSDAGYVLALFGAVGLVLFGCARPPAPEPKTPSPHNERLSEERKRPKDAPAPEERTAPSIVAPPPGYGNTIVHRREKAPDESRSKDR